ncbi:MAG: N-acetyltransferase [Streptomycetaceae bacterium]|nr:N-acetyltransferase [Streptomycetaceae bacterium]
MPVHVVHVPENDRYEVRVDGELAGYAEYMATEHVTVFTHSEVYDAYEGQGLGGTLAKGVLDAVRSEGRMVLPLCPFIKGWIARHPEYADLVVEDPRDTADG